MVPPTMYLEPGDLFFTAGDGLFTKIVTFHTSIPWWRRASVSHVGICVEGGPIHKARYVSAQASGVKEHGFWESDEWAVFRATNITDEEAQRFADVARTMIGLPYDFSGLTYFALDYWLGLGLVDPFWFRRLIRTENRAVCSAAATSWMAMTIATGKDFRIADPRRATPENLYRFCRETDYYYTIRPLSEV